MKRILCYGDSITWGYDPATDLRYDVEQTWPAVAAKSLGAGYNIITEALVGRTTAWDMPYAPHRNGRDFLPLLLESHAPLDLVIVMLGINDLNKLINKSADESAWGLLGLVREIMSPLFGGTPPKILIVSPPALGKLSAFNAMGFGGREEESKKLAACQKNVADIAKCFYLDSNRFIKALEIDGVHPAADQHKILGEKIAEKITEILE